VTPGFEKKKSSCVLKRGNGIRTLRTIKGGGGGGGAGVLEGRVGVGEVFLGGGRGVGWVCWMLEGGGGGCGVWGVG